MLLFYEETEAGSREGHTVEIVPPECKSSAQGHSLLTAPEDDIPSTLELSLLPLTEMLLRSQRWRQILMCFLFALSQEEKKRLKEEIEKRRAEAAEKRQKMPEDGLSEDKKPFKCFTPKGSSLKVFLSQNTKLLFQYYRNVIGASLFLIIQGFLLLHVTLCCPGLICSGYYQNIFDLETLSNRNLLPTVLEAENPRSRH